jgi:hypothetical protein
MATVSLRPRVVNRSTTLATLPSTLSPVHWAALNVAARKPVANTRDDLSPGEHDIDCVVRVCGTLTVGHDTETAATVTPSADMLLGLVLAKLNGPTRDKIIRELPRDFAAAGADYPAVPAEVVEQAEALTFSLRRKVTQKRRGAVSGRLEASIVPSLNEPIAATSVAVRRAVRTLRIAR